MPKVISVQALQRLPLYLQYLKTLPDAANISARALGAALGLALCFYEGLTGLSLGAVLVYQLVWCGIIAAVPFAKKP